MSSDRLTHSDDCPCSACTTDTPRDGEIEEEPVQAELPEREVPWTVPESDDNEGDEPERQTPWE